jgi:hypothetical protein
VINASVKPFAANEHATGAATATDPYGNATAGRHTRHLGKENRETHADHREYG